jgi:phage tail tube protein FII
MSFFYGLVEGLATSANEALQSDIKRINTRVDSIAERQLEKALKEQEERAKEVSEVEEALKEGYALFGGDANSTQAKQYAAGLLKEMGSLDAYRQRITELRSTKNNQGQDLGQFFTRASEDAPTGSLNDYANAFLGAPKTFAGDYRVPEGMRGESPAGGLVSKVVGKPIDVVQMGLTRAKEDITAAIGDNKFESVPLPTITFHAEKFKMSGMKASERIEYINNKLANPDNTQERNEKLQGMLNTALTAAADTGDTNTKIDAKKQMLSRTTSEEEKTALTNEISELTYQSEVTEAKASGDKVAEIDADIKRQQYLGNIDKVKELVKEKKGLTGDETSFKEITTELETDLMNGLANGTIPEGSNEAKAAMAEIEKRRDIEQNVTGAGDMKPAEIRGAQSYFNAELRNETQARLGALGQDYITILEAIENDTQDVVDLEGSELATYQKGQAIEAEVKGSLVSSMTSTFSEEDWPELYGHLRMKGLLPSDRKTTGDVMETGSGDQPVSTTPDTTTSVGDQTTEAIPTDTKAEKPVITVSEQDIANSRGMFPDTLVGADSYFESGVANNVPLDDMISSAEALKYGDAFIEKIKKLSSEKSTTDMETVATQDANMASDNNSDLIQQIVNEGSFLLGGLTNTRQVAYNLAEKTPDMDYNQALQFIYDNSEDIKSLHESQKERKPKSSRGGNRRSSGGGFAERKNN